jgi:serine/threonine-protein kinase
MAEVLAGRYELLGLLGAGGMGTVYRARDRELDEVVALKMLRKELVDAPDMLARFRQEAKLARKVTHKNVARTFDIGDHEGAKFLTMEYVDGESLSAVLARERRLSIARIVELAEHVCAGLSAAHAAGVVHRDLKPENVLVAKDGRIVVTDFGIARATDGRQTQGFPVGTPAYMAPEQVEAAPLVDARADIYALGAMLFELITGALPFDGESAYVIATRRLSEPAPDPRKMRHDVPDAVASVVMRCMARQPADRYASAGEVAAALSSITLPSGFTGPTAELPSVAPRAAVPPPTEARFKSVAVLPFRNAGPPDDEYLADGLTEDLIDTLTMNRALRVRSRGAVIRFRGVESDPRDIGRELDVHVVADGSVRRIGDALRVSVKLVSVEDGFQLWAKRFDRPAAGVLAVADEAAAAIAEALVSDWRAPPRASPTNPVALDLFLRARHEFGKRSGGGTISALRLYQEALLHAPNDTTILSHYAIALARSYVFGRSDETARSAIDARAIAERAIAEAPHLCAPHLAVATIELYTGDPARGVTEARKAISLAPMVPEAHELYGRILVEIGEKKRGLEHLHSAIRLDPRFEQIKFELARIAALEGDLEKCDELFSLQPSDPGLMDPYWLGRARVTMWRRDVALAAACQRAIAGLSFMMKDRVSDMFESVLERRVTDAGRLFLDGLLNEGRTQRRRAFFAQIVAEVWACAREEEKALEALRISSSTGLFDIFWLDRCPLFDSMRKDQRFDAIRTDVARRASALAALLTEAA